MTFRRRLTLAAAVAVAVAVAGASIAAWFIVRGELRGGVDSALVARAGQLTPGPPGPLDDEGDPFTDHPPLPGDRVFFAQIRSPGGDTLRVGGEPSRPFPVPAETLFGRPAFDEVTIDGTNFRTYSRELGRGFILTLALPLTEVDESLRRLAVILLVVTAGGIGLAVVLGLGVTKTAAAPVGRLTDATERVTETGDLSLRIDGAPAKGGDELGRLASSFNAMLGALEASVAAQRQLVADASHELRTPITSIRTNFEVLASGAELESADRERLLADLADQLEELTTTVNDLVELARDGEPEPVLADVRLDEVVRDAVRRAERRSGSTRFVVDADETVVRGDAARLSRAVTNLLDNAAKWSPQGGEVEVTVRGGTVSVRDHGPGFAEEDLPHVFDRFYRSVSARSMPGSGLGLAIARQVAEAHRGRAVAGDAPGGGAEVRLELPTDPRN